MLRSISRTCFFIISISIMMISCSEWDKEWNLGYEFTLNLFLKDQNEYADKIDFMKIFEVTNPKSKFILTKKYLDKFPVVYQTDNKNEILKFLEEIKDNDSNVKGCQKISSKEYHIIIYNNAYKECAYFRCYSCEFMDQKYEAIIPLGNPGIFYYRQLSSIFKIRWEREQILQSSNFSKGDIR